MNTYVILRRGGWRSPEELQAAAARSTAVGDDEMSDDIRWIRSYVMAEPDDGGLGTVCIYQASSPEKIREHADRAGLPVTEIIEVADKKKEVYDDDLIVIVRDGLRIFPEAYKLKYIQSSGGNQIIATAAVVLEKDGQSFRDSALGDGPIDAALKAIDRITGTPGRLMDYNVHSVTRGKDAVGEVFMKIDFGKVSFIGKAASTDIVDASARAYVNAINKMIHYQMALQEHKSAVDSAEA